MSDRQSERVNKLVKKEMKKKRNGITKKERRKKESARRNLENLNFSEIGPHTLPYCTLRRRNIIIHVITKLIERDIKRKGKGKDYNRSNRMN